MKKFAIVGVLMLVLTMVVPSVVSAASPISEKVTGGAWFISDNLWNLPSGAVCDGNEVHLGFVAMVKKGVVSGHGSVMDKDYRLKAILTVTGKYSGSQANPSVWPYDYEGTARLYINNVYQGKEYFRLNLTDPDSDGVIDSIGFVLGGDGNPNIKTGPKAPWYFAWNNTYKGSIKVH